MNSLLYSECLSFCHLLCRRAKRSHARSVRQIARSQHNSVGEFVAAHGTVWWTADDESRSARRNENVDSRASPMTSLVNVAMCPVHSTFLWATGRYSEIALLRLWPSILNKILALHSMCLLYIYPCSCCFTERKFYCHWWQPFGHFSSSFFLCFSRFFADVRGKWRTIGTRRNWVDGTGGADDSRCGASTTTDRVFSEGKVKQ